MQTVNMTYTLLGASAVDVNHNWQFFGISLLFKCREILLRHRDAGGKARKFVEVQPKIILEGSTVGVEPARLHGAGLRTGSSKLGEDPMRSAIEVVRYAILSDTWCKASGNLGVWDGTKLNHRGAFEVRIIDESACQRAQLRMLMRVSWPGIRWPTARRRRN